MARRYYREESPRVRRHHEHEEVEGKVSRRQHEREEMHRFHEEEMYAGRPMRDRMEREAAMMIREDHRAMANLPQEVVMREYPKNPFAMGKVPDTIASVDNQIRDDSMYQKDGRYPEKY